MRSSDWSSDVCSSDLELLERVINSEFERGHINESMLSVRDDMALLNRGVLWVTHEDEDGNAVCTEWLDREDFAHDPARCWRDVSWVARRAWLTLEEMKERFEGVSDDLWQRAFFRSEEHTSELQSLMRISYAVFCLKKKNIIITQCN